VSESNPLVSNNIQVHEIQSPSRAVLLMRTAPKVLRQMSKEVPRIILPAPYAPNPKAWPDTGLHVAWLGHSTVFIKVDGYTILTDPVFSDRVGIELGPVTVGMKRLVSPALQPEDLPHADLLLLSHAHMDHFDRPSLRALWNDRTSVVTAFRTSDLLRVRRYQSVQELGWGESVRVGAASVKAFEVNHWGARVRTDTYRGFNGYVIEIGGRRILFGGDTALTDTFKSVKTSKPIDLAIMPIGAYDPWIRFHCNPEQALKMANDAGADRILPVHHQTFQLSREPRHEPIERLVEATGADRVCLQDIGQEFHL
jgi:L-ascorbate metabolism protein UlaG (beta-lactamase superfamily)